MATNTRAMRCTPDDVFRVLANGWHYPAWVVGASRMRDVDNSWPAPGTKLHHSFGIWPLVIDDTTEVLEGFRSQSARPAWTYATANRSAASPTWPKTVTKHQLPGLLCRLLRGA